MCEIGSAEDSQRYAREIREAEAECRAALRNLGLVDALAWSDVLAIVHGSAMAGIVLGFTEQKAVSIFVRPQFRGFGIGDSAVEKLVERGDDLLVFTKLQATSYFEERGYRAQAEIRDPSTANKPGLLRLVPPTRQPGLRLAASVCLLEEANQRILIGRRLTAPWHGYWAFPGGKLDPGETALDGALRELEEETGVVPHSRAVRLRTRVYAGSASAVYRVDNFCIATDICREPVVSAEIAGHWLSLSDARALRPMAAGTRRVVRRVGRLLAQVTG